MYLAVDFLLRSTLFYAGLGISKEIVVREEDTGRSAASVWTIRRPNCLAGGRGNPNEVD